ncbi:MAG: iron-containing alcohol dehydrogenase [Pseudomonadota bacterium]
MSLITFLTRVHFADRVVEDALPEAMRRLSASRPLILSDMDALNGESRARVEDALPEWVIPASFPTLLLSEPHKRLDAAIETVRVAHCDTLICLGGKTAMDFGRVLAGLVPGRPELPVIAVPTTVANVGLGPVHMPAGTSVGPALPAAILCDATMTTHTDAETLAANGFSALTNCIEAFLSTAYNPPADGIALEGIRRSVLFLERATSDLGDLDAHRELLAAALNAGLAAQKGFGGAEALARAARDEWAISGAHGALYPAVIRPVLAFNAPAVGSRYARIGEAMMLSRPSDAIDALAEMGARLGLPQRLGALRPPSPSLDSIARRAAADPANRTNPRHATDADYRTLLQEAL